MELLFITGNVHKVEEVQKILTDINIVQREEDVP